ncbi:amino acid/polyamine/organocation transporter (APC superfamily) [Geodermatophilus tzadiensis]|uniref:Amino acid/polyamine/organocation transporter (APC superfamily) n=1 Tax=Geodermatophilus tzadiensis TaxID=1137988 RepID=A0A2T0TVB5_9ACTN|nr:APC family permease [Geodermatophilus tzadiensis]PRY49590.1 amino acid/polyamine/organocation transporter (APC superfamily) [Geodermatophilus tzadiensis]
MSERTAVHAAGAAPGSGAHEGAGPQLRGRMGVIELALTVLAFAAPLASVVAVLPLVIIFAGVGAPLAFVAATVMLLLFAVGYTTMSRYLPNPGAFYAYISAGLTKTLGLAASFLAILGYTMIGLGITLFFGLAASDLVATTFGGPAVPWWLYSLLLIVVVGSLAFFHIELSAKVLSLVMVLEIAVVLVFDVAVAADGGPEGLSVAPFALSNFSGASVGVAVLFAVITFIGFEATAIFREETRDPRRTVPRATYVSVAFIGVFYIVAVWLIIIAYGPSAAPDVAAASAPTMFPDAMDQFVGVWARDVLSVLFLTSSFAAVLSCQNIIARYGYSLGSDRALPSALGRVHPRHGSPYVSSIVLTVVFLLGVLAFSGSDPGVAYAWLAGAGGFPLLLLMFLTSVAVVVFFRRSRADVDDSTIWHTLIAPVLAMVALGTALYLAATNFVLLTGGDRGTAIALQVVIWGVFLVGIGVALYYRSKRPETYARIGRQKIT